MIYEGEKPGTLSAIEREDVSNGRKVKLKGNGDFRSDECIKFLKEADIVVTNPPFSLFREYVAQLMAYEKKFVIIGNQNALTYKEIFPLIKDNKLRCGYGAERTRQRSFKPQSEFNFLFRDTAGFQTDLPGSGTPN